MWLYEYDCSCSPYHIHTRQWQGNYNEVKHTHTYSPCSCSPVTGKLNWSWTHPCSPYSLQWQGNYTEIEPTHTIEIRRISSTRHLLTRNIRWTPGMSIPCCCLPTSSSVCLVFFPLSLCLAGWFWPDLMNRRHVNTASVCISVQWSGGLHVVRLPAGSRPSHPCW